MRITKLTEKWILQTAEILYKEFADIDAWPDMDSAIQEVQESLSENRLSLIAVDGDTVTGWVGGIPTYGGRVWELHPLVVAREYQGQGIGRLLVLELEKRAKELGGLTLWLGSDDEKYQTSISGIDLYPDVWQHMRDIRNIKNHPYEFYQKLGFVIVGLMPDANGFGKPDIYLAKRILG